MEELIRKICKENNIDCKDIKKSVSGFTNITFFVNDTYVIKVINTFTKPEKLQKEISFYKNVKLDFIPEYVASGNIDDRDYLIIKKIDGVSLYYIWHMLNKEQRTDAVMQIANILNKFHELRGEFLQPKFIQKDWTEKWVNSFKLNIDILKKKGFDTTFLQTFLDTKLRDVFFENKPCLIYNDSHFDNFIYDNGKIHLIDFDRVLYCSIDYELLVIKMMVEKPEKFANEQAEPYVKFDDYKDIYSLFKKYAPNMFDFKNIDDRVFIYTFIYRLGEGYEYNRNDWIEEQLNLFKKHFNY